MKHRWHLDSVIITIIIKNDIPIKFVEEAKNMYERREHNT